MNIKQLQHNLNYKHYYTGTPSIQANNFTLFIEVKIKSWSKHYKLEILFIVFLYKL